MLLVCVSLLILVFHISPGRKVLSMRTTCCLNLPPPTSNQTLNTNHPVKPTQLPLVKNEGGWGRRYIVMRIICSLMGVEMGNLVSGEVGIGLGLGRPMVMSVFPVPVVSSARWSEKRACPSWRHNSLETVVPENLPRPAARRRYEAVRSSHSMTAPPLSLPPQINTDCFSM